MGLISRVSSRTYRDVFLNRIMAEKTNNNNFENGDNNRNTTVHPISPTSKDIQLEHHSNRRDSGFDQSRRDSDVSVSSMRSQVLTKISHSKLVRQEAVNNSRKPSLPTAKTTLA